MKKFIALLALISILLAPTAELQAFGKSDKGSKSSSKSPSSKPSSSGSSRSPSSKSPSSSRSSSSSFNKPSSKSPSFKSPSSKPSSKSSSSNKPSPKSPSFKQPSSSSSRKPSESRPSFKPSSPSSKSDRSSKSSSIVPGSRPSLKPGERTIKPSERKSLGPGANLSPDDQSRLKIPGLGGERLGTIKGSDRHKFDDRIDRPAQLPARLDHEERHGHLSEKLRDHQHLQLAVVNRNQHWEKDHHHWDNHWHDRHWQHKHWHQGHWHIGGHGFWSNYWWNRYPLMSTFRLTTWGVNRCGWATGYYQYQNPYATPYVIDQSEVYYDYGQPIPIVESYPEVAEDGTTTAPDVSERGLAFFDRSMEEFYAGDYTKALASVNYALKEMPEDAAVHEFRALTLFALGRYDESAATLYAVLSVGPGWDWATMGSLYSSVELYTGQLRALERYRNSRPTKTGPRLVLAYHYLTAGHNEAAADQLERIVRIDPKDELSRNLLLSLNPDADVPKPKLADPPKPSAPIQKEQLIGNWNAKRGGDLFGMVLKADGKFSWIYRASNGEDSTVSGVWALDADGVIALDMGEDDVMLAQLNFNAGKLDFYMLGDTQGAEPLKFSK